MLPFLSQIIAPPGLVAVTTKTDSFNRADENLEASTDWTRVDGVAGALAVRSNRLAALSATPSCYLYTDLGKADHFLEWTLSLVGTNSAFAICRASNQNNWVGVRNSASAYQPFKMVGGTLTQIGTINGTPAVGDRLRIEVLGDTVTFYVNGASAIVGGNAPLGGDLAGLTRQGMVTRTSTRNPWLDDFTIGVL